MSRRSNASRHSRASKGSGLNKVLRKIKKQKKQSKTMEKIFKAQKCIDRKDKTAWDPLLVPREEHNAAYQEIPSSEEKNINLLEGEMEALHLQTPQKCYPSISTSILGESNAEMPNNNNSDEKHSKILRNKKLLQKKRFETKIQK